MMTKDKKPFTYTPGGIDLSQIKSPRMAKSKQTFNLLIFKLNYKFQLGISANAKSPGVGGPKISPLAQINNNGSDSPSIQTPQTPSMGGGPPPPPPPPPSMGSMAMGMPFQVLPPPPPPKANPQKLSPPQTNGNARKSPQSFDPPPLGCRPEIKIPENPMATLRKVGKPQPRDDYWVQEFMQEKARNSEPEDVIRQQIAASPQIQQQMQRPEYISTPPLSSPAPTKPATPQFSSMPQFTQVKPPSPAPERQEINIPIRNVKLEDVRSSPSPTRVYINQSPQLPASPITVAKNVVMEPIQSFSPQNNQQQSQGGRIILSTMPNRPQQPQQHVSFSKYLHNISTNKFFSFVYV